MSSSKLRACAVPFVPLPAAAYDSDNHLHGKEPALSVQQQQQQQQQQDDPICLQQLTTAGQQETNWEHDYDEHYYGYGCDSSADCNASEAAAAQGGDDYWASEQQDDLWQQAWPDMTSSWQLEEDALPADDSLQLLACWYPGQPRLLLEQVLEACEGNLQQASQVVWDIEWERRQAARQVAAMGPGNKDSTILPGSSKQQQTFQLRQEAFPALPSAGSAVAASGNTAAAVSTTPYHQGDASLISGVASMSLTSLAAAAAEEGADTWTNSCTGLPSSSSSSSTWANIAEKVPAKAQATSATPCTDPSSRATKANPRQFKQAAAAPATPAAAGTPSSSAAGAPAVPWVSTGDAVSQEYQSARAEARDFARVRNTCFQQATLAYLAGNKALAKELSMKGRQAAAQMWASHDQASQHIFRQRNARLTSPAAAGAAPGAPCSSMAHPVMDLHGLHVNEALVMLRQRLLQLTTQQSCRSISLIVGTGHHTKGAPAAKLGPAVEQLLKELGFSYKQPQPGLLRVQL